MVGLYRMRSGGEIVQSSFDFDTSTIGPYHIPVKLNYVPESSIVNNIPLYRFYQEMVKSGQALAIFNVNNYCLAILERTCLYEIAPFPSQTKLDLVAWNFSEPITSVVYNHIGYVKTFHKCKAISQYPTYLLADSVTGKIPDFTEQVEGVPLIDPPLSLYRELINSDAKAVYFDTISNKPKFLKY